MERELEDEFRFHFDHQVGQNVAAGMDPVDARYAALRQIGPLSRYKDECRDARRTHMIESFWEDSRYAIRNLRRDPFLAFAATLTLAACIGANTTVFSVANSILIRPLPYPASERIDWISERSGPAQQDVGVAPDYFALREQNRIFEELAAFGPDTVNWTGVERPEQLDAATVSRSFFRVMESRPMLGRTFAPEEEGPKAPSVAILSYAFWRNRLGNDPNILGKTIALDRLPHGTDLLGRIVGDIHVEFAFESEQDVDAVERIDLQLLESAIDRHRYAAQRRWKRAARRDVDAGSRIQAGTGQDNQFTRSQTRGNGLITGRVRHSDRTQVNPFSGERRCMEAHHQRIIP